MAENKRKVGVRVIRPKDVAKSQAPAQLDENEAYNAGDWLTPPADMRGFEAMVNESSTLPQCIRAYRGNICGFGINVRYKADQEETPEANAEFDRAKKIIEHLSFEKSTKEVFEDVIEARETFGIAYLEVIRNIGGEVEQIDFIEATETVEKTRPLEPFVDITVFRDGEEMKRKRRFRKYKQVVGGKVRYFKEFGDPRIMDMRDGSYRETDTEYQANEILEFKIGTKPYGMVRWVGQILGVDGSRKAERLNNNYFVNGRHTPLLITVQGGTLTDESYEKLQTYIDGIKGEAGQHSFLLLEVEGTKGAVDFDNVEKPTVEIKDLAGILQKDELFQEYLNNNRKRCQSSFLLPDIYTGFSSDYNRSTSQMAMEVTEEQVFQPERESLAWIVNNKLLADFRFRYVEAYFEAPKISNPEDLYKILLATREAGGLTPNKAKEILFSALGETSDDYEDEWGNTPLQVLQMQNVPQQLDEAIQKAERNDEGDIVSVLREVRKAIDELQERPAEVKPCVPRVKTL